MVVAHPLDPLSAEELSLAAEICKQYGAASGVGALRFNTITLQEPAKKALIAYEAGGPLPPRQAFCILQTPPEAGLIEAIVTLDNTPSVAAWNPKEGVQALATPDDCFDAEAIAKADPDVQALLAEKYGITDLEMVACDPWSVHLPPFEGRLIQTFMYARVGSVNDNAYAHPIDFVPIVDLNLHKVVAIDKLHGDSPPPLASQCVNYHRDLCEVPIRTDLKPLDVVQPEGASWTVTGNLVEWQKWSIRVGFNYREGLVLHQVGYKDGDVLRPILHRLSLAEMCVPYGDSNPIFSRKAAFDVGDYGLGFCTTSLALGCDCLGNIHYFDAVLNNTKGEPVLIPKAVCMHEEDAGVLWKHVEYRNGHSEVRRSRRLVLSFVTTVVNYEYAFYISFYQDGTIQYEIKLTGELSTNMLSPAEGDQPLFGTLVAPGVNAQYHQHNFCARIDMAVDDAEGGKNVVVSEVDVVALDQGPENPAGNAFTVQETKLLTELQAQRVADPFKGRYWKVSNPSSLNPINGKPVAWKILVPTAPLLLASPESSLTKRGGFATKTLFVTPHQDEERWPAGDYPMQGEGGVGLPEWTAADRPCGEGHDPVIWLSFGATHIPRIEDFPCMPCEVVGFHIKPFCFFTGNPGIDVPNVTNGASKLAGQACCAANGVANGDH